VTDKQLAKLLVEKLADANINKKIAVFVNRLMLRLHSQPALMANLADVSVFKPGIHGDTEDQVKDGRFQEGDEEQKPRKDHDKPVADDDEQKGDESEAGDKLVLLQLSFRRLPQEVVSPLLRLIAAPRAPKLSRFTKDGVARTGVEIDLKPSDFPGDDYDYAF
jgi:hypothetical protein